MKNLIILILITLTTSIFTGASFGFTQEAVENFKDDVLPYILSKQQSIPVPDQYFNFGKGVFRVIFMIQNSTIYNLNLDVKNTRLVFAAPDIINANIENLSGKVALKWSYESNLGADGGNAMINLEKTLSSFKIKLSTVNGRPLVSIEELLVNIGDLNIQFIGSPTADVAN